MIDIETPKPRKKRIDGTEQALSFLFSHELGLTTIMGIYWHRSQAARNIAKNTGLLLCEDPKPDVAGTAVAKKRGNRVPTLKVSFVLAAGDRLVYKSVLRSHSTIVVR